MSSGNSRFFVYKKLTKEQVGKFHEKGYLFLGRTLTEEGLEKIREQVMAAWRAEKGKFDPNKTWLQNALIPDIHRRALLVRNYYFSGPLVDISEQLIGPNIKAATSQLTFKMRGNTQTFAWHQDNGYGELDPYNALSTLTALDDCDQENGCLWVLLGSKAKGQMLQHKPDLPREIRMEVDESKALPIEMKAGDSCVMHCWTLHKSGPNLSKTKDRRILFMRFADADAVEVYNNRVPRLGRLLRGTTRFKEVRQYEAEF